MLLMDYDGEDAPYETTMLFLATSHARIFCGALALCSLLGIVVERGCATYFLADYENKKRLYIPVVIIEVLLLNAAFSTVTYHSFSSTLPHGLAYLLCNLLAVVGNTVNNRLNRRRYHLNTSRTSATGGRYTLAERYQISENICTSKALRDTFYLVPFFNALCLVAIFIDNLDVDIGTKNLGSVCLNFAALVYALLVPLVLLFHKKNLRRECKRLLEAIGLHNLSNAYKGSHHLKSTLGEEIIVDKMELSTTHFAMLRNDWEGQGRENQPMSTAPITK